jgi:hypothetical protein
MAVDQKSRELPPAAQDHGAVNWLQKLKKGGKLV